MLRIGELEGESEFPTPTGVLDGRATGDALAQVRVLGTKRAAATSTRLDVDAFIGIT